MSDDGAPEVFEVHDPRASIREVADLLTEIRKLSPHSEEALKVMVGLLIQMGKFTMEAFEKMAANNLQLLAEHQKLVGHILDLQVRFQSYSVEKAKVDAKERSTKQGIESVEKVLVTLLEKLDPQILNDFLREGAGFMRREAPGGTAPPEAA